MTILQFLRYDSLERMGLMNLSKSDHVDHTGHLSLPSLRVFQFTMRDIDGVSDAINVVPISWSNAAVSDSTQGPLLLKAW